MFLRYAVRRFRILLGGFALGLFLGSPASASTCDELVRQARAHEAARDDDLAVRRYTEAIALDAVCGDAYLGLGSLRAKRGDAREAERVLSLGLEHVPTMRAAIPIRARARWSLGDHAEAERDLLAYTDDASIEGSLAALQQLAQWYADEGRTPAQLATWRRLFVLSEGTPLAREARLMVRALTILVGTADPVTSPSRDDTVRRLIARAAR